MEINKNNYPEILIDYLDGKLSALQVAEVLIFLEQNPDIKNEFEDLNSFVLEPHTIALLKEEKQEIKKNFNDNFIHNTSIDELIVAQMEGDLSANSSSQVDKLISENENLSKLKSLFLFTKVVPDFEIKFIDKRQLKKSAPIIVFYRTLAIAASLLLMIGLSFFIFNNSNQNVIENKNNSAFVLTKKENKIPVVANVNVVKTESNILHQPNQKTISKKNEAKDVAASIKKQKLQQLISLEITPIKLPSISESQIAINQKQLMPLVFNHDENELENDAKEFPTIAQFIKNKIIKKGKSHLEENNVPLDKKENFDALHIASAGADVLNKATGTNLNFKRNYDKKGKVKSFAFAAGNFSFEKGR